MTRLEFVEGSSKKFWEVDQDGKRVVVRWGRLGTDGQSKTHAFSSPAIAAAQLDVLVASKLKKGYRRAGGDAPLASARNPALEAAMFDAGDDARPALVYADWLQAQGNPWGELITVQHALEKKPKDKALRAREKVLLAPLGIPEKDYAKVAWRRGVLESVHLFNQKDWMDMSFDALGPAKKIFDLPMCDGLAELHTGVLRWEANAKDVFTVLSDAAKRPFAKRLKRLFLGDVPDDIDMAHHVIGDLRKLSAWFPNLEWLKLHSGDQSWSGPRTFELAPLKLPRLETLIIETCSLSKQRADAVMKSELPALRTLELWFGSAREGAVMSSKALAPLLDGGRFPRVTHLGLRNAEFTNELCTVLPRTKVAAQLESLDLSMGTMDAAGAQALAAGAAAFKKLKKLDVSDSFLVKSDLAALKKAFKGVELAAKEQKAVDENEPEWRYCSVGE